MIAVAVNRPLREHHVRHFRVKPAAHFVIVSAIYNGSAVPLTKESRTGFQDLARLLRFGRSHRTALRRVIPVTISFAAIQVQQHRFMSQVRITSDGTGASAFRISWMATGHHDLEPARWGRSQKRDK
jgi:hypothetical protein